MMSKLLQFKITVHISESNLAKAKTASYFGKEGKFAALCFLAKHRASQSKHKDYTTDVRSLNSMSIDEYLQCSIVS